MMRVFAKRRWKNAGNLIMNLNKKMGRDRVQSFLLNTNADSFVAKSVLPEVEEMKRCNRRTSTPAEMKEIALLAIHAAKEEGWTEAENRMNEESKDSGDCILPQSNGDPIPRSKSEGGKCNPWAQVDEDFTGIHLTSASLTHRRTIRLHHRAYFRHR
jgi:hypothetical protein